MGTGSKKFLLYLLEKHVLFHLRRSHEMRHMTVNPSCLYTIMFCYIKKTNDNNYRKFATGRELNGWEENNYFWRNLHTLINVKLCGDKICFAHCSKNHVTVVSWVALVLKIIMSLIENRDKVHLQDIWKYLTVDLMCKYENISTISKLMSKIHKRNVMSYIVCKLTHNAKIIYLFL